MLLAQAVAAIWERAVDVCKSTRMEEAVEGGDVVLSEFSSGPAPNVSQLSCGTASVMREIGLE